MLSKITLALAFAFAVSSAVQASAGPRTCGYVRLTPSAAAKCGYGTMQYDSSGTWTGPYCD